MSNPIESLKNQATDNSNPVDIERTHYELMNKLYETLNIRKGFDVAMRGGPREGKLFLTFEGVEFTLNVQPTVSESQSELGKMFR